jgi:hypothetical protein
MVKEPEEVFRYLRDHEARLLQFQFTVVAWVLGALLTVNSGALVAVLNALDKRPQLAGAATPFVVGIVLAFVCAVCLWFNVVCHGEAVTDRMDWRTLSVRDPKSADSWDHRATIFAGLALVALAASVGSFAWGALTVQAHYQTRAIGHQGPPAAAQTRPKPDSAR